MHNISRSEQSPLIDANPLYDLIGRQLDHTLQTVAAVRADKTLAAALVRAAERIAATMTAGGKLMVAGNGGSAADAQHLVAEFVMRLNRDRPALPAIALTTDTSILTAIGNDTDYVHIFERQIEALGRAGDVFLGISTSGNAKNLLQALHTARARGITTVGFIGNGGGSMGPLCDIAVIVPSRITMHIQESQLALEHILTLLVEQIYFGPGFDNLPQYLAE